MKANDVVILMPIMHNDVQTALAIEGHIGQTPEDIAMHGALTQVWIDEWYRKAGVEWIDGSGKVSPGEVWVRARGEYL